MSASLEDFQIVSGETYMSEPLRKQLIRLGASRPDLQKHIRPILDEMCLMPKAKESSKTLVGDVRASRWGYEDLSPRAKKVFENAFNEGSLYEDQLDKLPPKEQTKVVSILTDAEGFRHDRARGHWYYPNAWHG